MGTGRKESQFDKTKIDTFTDLVLRFVDDKKF